MLNSDSLYNTFDMKTTNKIRHILALFSGVLLLFGAGSCGEKLDLNPKNQFAKDAFWTNEVNAMIALTGVYRGNINYGTQTNPSDWWTYAGLVLFEHTTDNAYDRRGKNAAQNKITNGNLLANNDVIKTYWSGSFVRIAACNNFLENVIKVKMDEAKIRRMAAEARFIRACQYFYLSQFWGNVPLV